MFLALTSLCDNNIYNQYAVEASNCFAAPYKTGTIHEEQINIPQLYMNLSFRFALREREKETQNH